MPTRSPRDSRDRGGELASQLNRPPGLNPVPQWWCVPAPPCYGTPLFKPTCRGAQRHCGVGQGLADQATPFRKYGRHYPLLSRAPPTHATATTTTLRSADSPSFVCGESKRVSPRRASPPEGVTLIPRTRPKDPRYCYDRLIVVRSAAEVLTKRPTPTLLAPTNVTS